MATTNYQTMEKGMQAYHEASARQCPLHNVCDCCTCRCCAFCILICWVILGVAGAILYFSLNSDLTYYSDCPSDSKIDGECCGAALGQGTAYVALSCDKARSAYDIMGANSVG